jgi:hypothetical protein
MPEQWIIGYGSLMDRASRTRQAPRAQAAFPVQVAGFSVDWFHQFKATAARSLSPTFLGARQLGNTVCGGVLYKVNESDLVATDEREAGYTRASVPFDALTLLTGSGVTLQRDDRFWIYVSREDYIGVPSKTFPLVQSYVDLCLNGALEAAQSYPATAGHFPSWWIGTIDWQPVRQSGQVWWLNDRAYPYRASFTLPNASMIDTALADNSNTPDLWQTASRQFALPR